MDECSFHPPSFRWVWAPSQRPEPGGMEETVLTDPFDYAAEDRLIDAWQRTIANMPPVPFATETPEQLGRRTVVLETTLGNITIGFDAQQAPEHVRNFLQLAQAGVLDGTPFHRVVRGFVVQAGSVAHRSAPLTEKQQKFVRNLQPEFNDTKHVKGIVSMARGDDPASASTSFFIVTADAPSLDGKYTVFGRVIDGLDVLDKIEATPVSGESPTTRIDLVKVRVVG